MIDKVEISNFRSCISTSFRCHPRLSVLIGPNGSGKTNVLNAIAMLPKLADPPRLRRDRSPITEEHARLNADFRVDDIRIRLRAGIDQSSDDGGAGTESRVRPLWTILKKGEKPIKLTFPLAFFADNVTQRGRISASHGSSPHSVRGHFMESEIPQWSFPVIKQVAHFCGGIRYYSASQFTNPGACPVSFEVEKDPSDGRSIPPRPWQLEGHSRILYAMYQAHTASDRRNYEQFIDIVGPDGLKLIDRIDFREFPTSTIDYTIRVGGKVERRRKKKAIIVPQFKRGRVAVSPNQLSEGTFKTLALLFYVITETSTALLIEEPEVCVHHGLLSSIMELIAQYSKTKQMFVSTHSDYVLDKVDPSNVYTVQYHRNRGTGVTHIKSAMSSQEYSALRKYLESEGNLGEYWREGGLEDLQQ
jgi:ABC-type lipoprotein export system ATPase subunit